MAGGGRNPVQPIQNDRQGPSNGAQNAAGLSSLLMQSLAMSPSKTAGGGGAPNPGADQSMQGVAHQMAGNPEYPYGINDQFARSLFAGGSY